MTDRQASAYDDFAEDAETVFRLFDEGEKKITKRPEAAVIGQTHQVRVLIWNDGQATPPSLTELNVTATAQPTEQRTGSGAAPLVTPQPQLSM